MAATMMNRVRPSMLNLPFRYGVCLSHRAFSAAAETSAPDRKTIREAKKMNREKGMEIQSAYKSRVNDVVSTFREERIEQMRLRQAAEGEQQKLLEREKIAEKRIIEGVEAENAMLADLRQERIELEEWKKTYHQMKKKAKAAKREEELKEMRIEMVNKAIEESKEFITPDNLDEKIAYALENETNYNFALTPEGKKLHSTRPPGNANMDMPGPAAFVLSPNRKDLTAAAENLLQENDSET
ncbi:uncharacterized protein LOC5520939 isoform X2 [Nematostella vectensis]|uniref:uncharacterized protein LOC5520939 isoform X1 n=1 Tax=Nematostella vectensis TaxID=45351 RepID=UPI00207715B7|nr:uncharacterized protein LOC5520939 isoform X1 [Nematostella vectensis]XP_048585505.1 uncharacterized protein LOC5520939 isoform X2 [Nematostella vectensis]